MEYLIQQLASYHQNDLEQSAVLQKIKDMIYFGNNKDAAATLNVCYRFSSS